MSLKIDSDVERFRNIVKGKFRKDLKKHITSGSMVAQQGRKKLAIPMPGISIPHFTFGGKQVGGVGQDDGTGQPGDKIGSGKGKGQGGKEADEDSGEHFTAEFTPDELAKILGEELQLPRIENKGKEQTKIVKHKYTDISKEGVILHRKRTYKNALVRSIMSGTYDFNDPAPYVMPIKEDRRYKTYETKVEPDVSVLVMYARDYSGSMSPEMTARIQSCAFWVSLWLKHNYGKIEERFFAHDTEAMELERDDFFGRSEGGGTRISSVLEKCSEVAEENKDRNIYCLYFSDDGNIGSDNPTCVQILNEKLLPLVNLFCYGSVAEHENDGGFYGALKEGIQSDKCVLAHMPSNDSIMDTIKAFLGTGK